MNWKKILWLDERLPKSSYILRTFVGFYLIYIVYQIISGLGEQNVTNPVLVIIAAVFFSLFCLFCLASGTLGLFKKTYREAHDDTDLASDDQMKNDEENDKTE